MTDFDYDLFVIGGGSGGVRAARVAAATGAKVALAEEYRMGGTCVIRGCVPKKLMVFASEYHEMFADARAYGWDVEDGQFDWTRFRGKLHAELLDALPKSILIVGGGYIACEFACILHGLGVAVTQFYRGAQILRGFDDEARGLVSEEMQQRGVDLHLGTNVFEMEKRDAGVWIKATNGTEGTFDHVMFATGRAPNTDGMGLAEAGVELGRQGQIVVDDYSQTKVPSIFAIGDVTNRDTGGDPRGDGLCRDGVSG